MSNKVKDFQSFLNESAGLDEFVRKNIGESTGPDNFVDMEISKLIDDLHLLQAKKCTTVQVKGTLFCKEDGNYIILSSEKQM